MPRADDLVEAINVITGWTLTMDDVLKIGERIANIRMAFNIREGLNNREFKVPDRITGRTPKTYGPKAGFSYTEDEAYNEFLTAMDWDLKTTKPSRKEIDRTGS